MPPVVPVDSTGAGDCCNAGLIAGLLDGLALPERGRARLRGRGAVHPGGGRHRGLPGPGRRGGVCSARVGVAGPGLIPGPVVAAGRGGTVTTVSYQC